MALTGAAAALSGLAYCAVWSDGWHCDIVHHGVTGFAFTHTSINIVKWIRRL